MLVGVRGFNIWAEIVNELTEEETVTLNSYTLSLEPAPQNSVPLPNSCQLCLFVVDSRHTFARGFAFSDSSWDGSCREGISTPTL